MKSHWLGMIGISYVKPGPFQLLFFIVTFCAPGRLDDKESLLRQAKRLIFVPNS